MIRSFVCGTECQLKQDLALEEIADALQEPGKTVWVSLETTTSDEFKTVLSDLFHFHPLAIEDCQSQGYQPPKVDDFGSYLFIVIHGIGVDSSSGDLVLKELDCFLGRNYLVTSYQTLDMPPIEAMKKRFDRDERLHNRGMDFLCHAILDRLVDEYMPILDEMDEELDKLEDMVLEHPRTEALQRVLSLKHNILTLRRVVSPEREVMNRLSRDDLPQISAPNRIYFRDVYDHLVRIHDLSESLRDVTSGTLDTYLSVTSNRLNEIMKALTVVSTIFLPLTFLAGIYGMNFRYMPELNWHWGYPMVWAICIGIVAGMLWFFRRHEWL